MKRTFNLIVGALILGILGLIAFILLSDLNAKESGLVSLLLTVLSVIVSFLISNYYSQITHKKAIEEVREQHLANLKTYALNAAEKVSNLSNELTRLAYYLQNDLDEETEENREMLNHSLTERIESAIHIINTLKSVNDTSLSDWRGVIGEELNEQLEEKIERENELKSLIERVEALVIENKNTIPNQKFYGGGYPEELKTIRKELSYVASSLGGKIIRPKSSKPVKEDIESKCPECGEVITYKQRPLIKSFKPVKCTKCGKRAASRYYSDKGFVLEPEIIKEEDIECPWCGDDIEFNISSVPYTTTTGECPSCSGQIKVIRNIDGFKVNKFGQNPEKIKETLSDELIDKIDALLPEQPWPTGQHKVIAQELGVSVHLVSKAITKLIEQGKYYPQVGGIVYTEKRDKTIA